MTVSALDEFREGFSFPLDDFQLAGCRALADDQDVLVCAPTGAGKTIVAEFAVQLALRDGGRCFYTTPIKALSNQKHHDLGRRHGVENVGLLTGDQVINPTASIIVMTTEVLRNMIYAASPALTELTHVVMDEVHYLADRERGPVWEEVILNLAAGVRLVCLSATVSNAEEFGDWLTSVRGRTQVVVTELRPVPLEQHVMVGTRLFDMFADTPGRGFTRDVDTAAGRGVAVNPHLIARTREYVMRIQRAVEERRGRRDDDGARWENRRGRRGGDRGKPGREGRSGRDDRHRSGRAGPAGGRPGRKGGNGRHGGRDPGPEAGPWRPPKRADVIRALSGEGLLPAITFIFSRAGCDAAVGQCLKSDLRLTDADEATEIRAILGRHTAELPADDLLLCGWEQFVEAAERGFASHHAGMLPAFRHAIEEVFPRGLVKAVFATETLALGINMPARAVLLEQLVKFDGSDYVDLTPGQYTQLTGRAGRRGIDTRGHAVVLWNPEMDVHAVAGLASTRTYPLHSSFVPGYNMSVNLLSRLGRLDAKHLLECSFAQFQSDRAAAGTLRRIATEEARVAESETRLAAAYPPGFEGREGADHLTYSRLLAAVDARRAACAAADRAARLAAITAAMGRLDRGDVVAIRRGTDAELAVVLGPATNSLQPRLHVCSTAAWAGTVTAEAFVRPPERLARVPVSRHLDLSRRRGRAVLAEHIEKTGVRIPATVVKPPRGSAGTDRQLRDLTGQVRAHPWNSTPARSAHAGTGQKWLRATRLAAALRAQVESATGSLGRTFDRILDLLGEMGYVEMKEGEETLSEYGTVLARLHSGTDLLIAQCLRRRIWAGLDPAELAGAVSSVVYEARREQPVSAEPPTEPLRTALAHTVRVWEDLAHDEDRHELPRTRQPHDGIAGAMHQWTAGAPLAAAMYAALENGQELTPGDFVRSARQVVDMLEQIEAAADDAQLCRHAGLAADTIRRGVVAVEPY